MKTIIATLTLLTVIALTAGAQTTIQQTTPPPQPVAPAQETSVTASLGLYIYPSKGQTKETQTADEAACYTWAVEQSGVDPRNPPDVQAAPVDTSPDGTAVRSAARGAAAGAAIGAITGDAGEGAAVGAVVGGMRGMRGAAAKNMNEQKAAEANAQKQEAALMNNFVKAYTACLEGKGYTVK